MRFDLNQWASDSIKDALRYAASRGMTPTDAAYDLADGLSEGPLSRESLQAVLDALDALPDTDSDTETFRTEAYALVSRIRPATADDVASYLREMDYDTRD